MRTFWIILVFILWLLLGLFYYNTADNCCDDTSAQDLTEEVQEQPNAIKSIGPLEFNWSDASPVFGQNWKGFRDSLLGIKTDNNLLQITGHYRADETNATSFDNLGLARADSIRLRWFGDWPLDQLQLNARMLETDVKDKSQSFPSAAFKYLINSENIKEVQDRTLIYFPFNSTRKLASKEVEDYLDDVAERVVKSKEKVKLVGHTDSVGSPESNQLLGLQRAQIIGDYLMARGVLKSKIILESDGDKSPVAENTTKEGRAKNRRTELQIIK